jgi:hypothetical protein
MVMKRSLIAALLMFAGPAVAEDMSVRLPYFGVSPWGDWSSTRPMQWDGEYLRVNSGYSFTSFRKGASVSGPTVGIEAGKYWREGNWVHGASVEADYMHSSVARFGGANALPIWTRDFAGTARIKSGYLVQPNLLVYGSVGVTAVNQTWRAPGAFGAKDTDFVVRPDMRAGAIWAVNDKTTITVEVGVRPPIR